MEEVQGGDEEVQRWLASIKLGQYWQNFKQEGYDILEAVKTISSREEIQTVLKISKAGHVALLWNAIQQLQQSGSNVENTYSATYLPRLPSEQSLRLQMGVVIGRGSSSTVYHGKWICEATQKEQDVAIKQIHSVSIAEKNRARSEYDLLLRVKHHPHIVQALDIQERGGELLVIMEYLPLGSLRKFIRAASRPLPLSLILHLSHNICSGLQFLHSKEIIHRDVACRNVFLYNSEDGMLSAKIGDLGMSREGEDWTRGTEFPVKWTAPEGFHGHYTKAGDVWSFANTVIEMMLREHPFPQVQDDPIELGELAIKIRDTHLHPEIPEPYKSESQAFTETLQRCWKPNSSERPSFETLLNEIEAVKTAPSAEAVKPETGVEEVKVKPESPKRVVQNEAQTNIFLNVSQDPIGIAGKKGGWLAKKWNKNKWESHWWKIGENELLCYSDSDESNQLSKIQLAGGSCEEKGVKGILLKPDCRQPNATLALRASTKEERDEWMMAIKAEIRRHDRASSPRFHIQDFVPKTHSHPQKKKGGPEHAKRGRDHHTQRGGSRRW